MADLLKSGMDWLADQVQAELAQSVSYRRGANSVTINAVLGRSILRTTDRLGNVKVERTDRDLIFRAADLVISGSVVTPLRGDRFRVTIGSTTYEYEVMPPAGEAPWRYSDPFNEMIRVHGKFVGTV